MALREPEFILSIRETEPELVQIAPVAVQPIFAAVLSDASNASSVLACVPSVQNRCCSATHHDRGCPCADSGLGSVLAARARDGTEPSANKSTQEVAGTTLIHAD